MIFSLARAWRTLQRQHTWIELKKDVKATQEQFGLEFFLRIHPAAVTEEEGTAIL